MVMVSRWKKGTAMITMQKLGPEGQMIDGQDTDCDGEIDEDAEPNDGYAEPNDNQAWGLGVLEDEDSFYLEARLHNEQDVDLFEVQMKIVTPICSVCRLHWSPFQRVPSMRSRSLSDTGEVLYSILVRSLFG